MEALNFIKRNRVCMQKALISGNKNVSFSAGVKSCGRLTRPVILSNLCKVALFSLCVMACSCVTPKKFKAYKENTETEIANLKQENSTLKNTNDSQNVAIAGLQRSLTDLETKLLETEGKLYGYQSQLNVLTEDVSGVKGRVNSLGSKVEKIEKDNENQWLNSYVKEESENVKVDLSSLDDYVLSINYNGTDTEDYAALVNLITQNANTKYEKARAIFMWLANNISYDVTYSIYDADRTFSYRRGVCSGYSKLYKKLCEQAGLEVKIVSGVARYESYQKGDDLDGKGHAWNAVKSDDGRWFLVDVTWAAGYVCNKVFTKDIETYWFDPDPSMYALSHLPSDSEWQLIENPITREEFENFPSMYPGISLMGISGKALLNKFRNEEEPNFPKLYYRENVRINQAPMTAILSSERTYKFSITSTQGDKILISQGDKRIDFNEDGVSSSIEYQPEKGELRIMVYSNGWYDPVIKYEVK